MIRTVVATALILSGSLSAPASAGAPTLAQLAGTWGCFTVAGSLVLSTFDVDASGSVVEHQVWKNGSQGGTWDQQFTYDASSQTWTVRNHGSNEWTFLGTSKGFDGTTITFTGTQQEGDLEVPTRERYIFSQQHFDHVWDKRIDGQWRPTSFAECDLVPSPSVSR